MIEPQRILEPTREPPGGSRVLRGLRAVLLERRLPHAVGVALDRSLKALGRRFTTVREAGYRVRVRRGTWDAQIVRKILVDAEYTRGGFDIPAGGIVVDVGANLGSFSLLAARVAGHVYAFEPGPREYELLRRNLERNRIGNVTAVAAAIGGADGTCVLHLGRESALNTVRADRVRGSAEGSVTVRQMSLKSVFEAFGIERCDLLKLDCEGAEYDILYSAPPALLDRIDRITMEYHVAPTEDKRTTADGLGEYLERRGFDIVLYEDFVGHDCGMMRAQRRRARPS